MAAVFKARFENGVLKPFGDFELEEGEVVVFARVAELWRPGMDWDEIRRALYEARELGSRDMDDYPKFD